MATQPNKATSSYQKGSTAMLMEAFTVQDLGLSRAKPNTEIVILNANAGSLNHEIHTLPEKIKQLSKQQNQCTDRLTRLEQSLGLSAPYAQRFVPLVDSAKQLSTESDAMKKHMVEFLSTQHQLLSKTPDKPTIEKLKKQQQEILSRIEKFETNASALRDKLKRFDEELRKTLIAAGVSPETPAPMFGN